MKFAFFWDFDVSPPNFLREIFLERDIPIVRNVQGLDGFFMFENGQLCFSLANSQMNKISFDWVASWNYHKRQNYRFKKDLLHKALGLKRNKNKTVWDLTCGTGKDTILMLFFGMHVVAFERSPVVSALLMDAWRRALSDQESGLGEIIKNKFSLYFGDPRNFTEKELISVKRPEVFYIDPMFPEKKKKSALSGKNMQVFKEIVGQDQDSLDLFFWAKNKKAGRVVVKRAKKNPPICPDPTTIYVGKSTRYDVYV